MNYANGKVQKWWKWADFCINVTLSALLMRNPLRNFTFFLEEIAIKVQPINLDKSFSLRISKRWTQWDIFTQKKTPHKWLILPLSRPILSLNPFIVTDHDLYFHEIWPKPSEKLIKNQVKILEMVKICIKLPTKNSTSNGKKNELFW